MRSISRVVRVPVRSSRSARRFDALCAEAWVGYARRTVARSRLNDQKLPTSRRDMAVGGPNGHNDRTVSRPWLKKEAGGMITVTEEREEKLETVTERARPKLPLRPRERQIADLMLDHFRVPAIAAHLGISDHTVRNHLKNMYRRLGVHSQQELLVLLKEEAGTPSRFRPS